MKVYAQRGNTCEKDAFGDRSGAPSPKKINDGEVFIVTDPGSQYVDFWIEHNDKEPFTWPITIGNLKPSDNFYFQVMWKELKDNGKTKAGYRVRFMKSNSTGPVIQGDETVNVTVGEDENGIEVEK
jgi:hypothetical protein